MTTNTPSPPDQAFIDAIIAAYDSGLSYDGVARELGSNTTKVQSIMRLHAPDSIRTPEETFKVRPQYTHTEHGLTLASLGLYAVGPCEGTRFSSCGIPLVAKRRENPVTGQTCGLCLDYARRRKALKAPRRAA